jgi:uncharacterized protein
MLGGLALGIAVGSVSGLIGLGGGVFLIPALTFFYGMSQKRAQGTSVATLLLPVGILAFWAYYKAGHVDLKLAMFIAVGFTIGGYFGGIFAQHLSDTVLRRGFAVLLVLLAIKLAFQR